jgi:hypothetical protein
MIRFFGSHEDFKAVNDEFAIVGQGSSEWLRPNPRDLRGAVALKVGQHRSESWSKIRDQRNSDNHQRRSSRAAHT